MLQISLPFAQRDEEVLKFGVLGQAELTAIGEDTRRFLKCIHDCFADNSLEGHEAIGGNEVVKLGLETVSVLKLCL